MVRACHEAEVPWVARGAGSGLSGGALPVEDGILIALSRLRRILEVDIPNGRVLVEPGVTNIAVSQAVAPTHFFPPDPSSQIVCTIGGNVAENSGGAHCFKYGFTTNYVTGLELVLPDGSEVTLGGPELDHPGYDLLGAFVGSEGTLGIATKIWLRVVPKPEAVRTLVAFFGSTVAGGRGGLADRLRGHRAGGHRDDGQPLDPRRRGRDGRRLSDGRGSGAGGGAGRLRGRVRDALRARDRDVRGRGQRPRGQGRGRARADLAHAQGGLRRHGPHRAELLRAGQRDPAHPPGRGARHASTSSAAEHDLQVANVFHAGDGNLHPLVCYDGAQPGEAERAEELAGLIVKACVDAGGSITGEHGVGVDKKRYMPSMFDEPDLATFQRLRCAFDPDGRANPGKVMPTPRLCGEVPGPYRRHPLEQAGVAERF